VVLQHSQGVDVKPQAISVTLRSSVYFSQAPVGGYGRLKAADGVGTPANSGGVGWHLRWSAVEGKASRRGVEAGCAY
jgi:hypothetical protein